MTNIYPDIHYTANCLTGTRKSLFHSLLQDYGSSSDQESVEEWAKGIQGGRVFSQSGEDGAIEAVFDRIGTTDKIYVEFGVGDCTECNSRNLRENKGWDVQRSLLLDGGFEDAEINLHKAIFFPDNILGLFAEFGVPRHFDFLSVDTDSYDFFMLETILEAGYSPRAIMVEHNVNFEITEAKSILPPEKGEPWQFWAGDTYMGMSLLAAKLLLQRFHYSVVWCNVVNCLAVLDSALGSPARLSPTFLFKGRGAKEEYPCDHRARQMAVIGEDGRWDGRRDGGEGSPNIRCTLSHRQQRDLVAGAASFCQAFVSGLNSQLQRPPPSEEESQVEKTTRDLIRHGTEFCKLSMCLQSTQCNTRMADAPVCKGEGYAIEVVLPSSDP